MNVKTLLLMALAVLEVLFLAPDSLAQTASTCPQGVPGNVTCYSGQDVNGAYYLIALPGNWNGTLFLYNHGGPGFAAGRSSNGAIASPVDMASDLGAPGLLLSEGVAVAASSYRQYGYAVVQDAQDVDNLRSIFVKAFGRPRRTLVQGLSYGGIVTAKLVELFGSDSDGLPNYDGALIACGEVQGIRRFGYTWVDLRAVYQYYCGNLPKPDEPQYELWRGLTPGSGPIDQIANNVLTTVPALANACTGFQLPPDQRSDQQRANLANILNVTQIPLSDFSVWIANFATAGMYDVSGTRLQGRNAFPNIDVRYQGSTDDEALNRGVARYASDPEAVAILAADTEPTGKVTLPVLTLHGIGDTRIFVESQAVYRETFQKAGTLQFLQQTYVDTVGHCVFSTSEYQAVTHGLLNWINTGAKPTPDEIASSCRTYQATIGDQCRFNTNYQPLLWKSRVPPREP